MEVTIINFENLHNYTADNHQALDPNWWELEGRLSVVQVSRSKKFR